MKDKVFLITILILCLFVNAYGYFEDDFSESTYVDGSVINGQNGWQDVYGPATYGADVLAGDILEEVWQGREHAQQDPALWLGGTFSAIGRDITGDVVGGKYWTQATFYAQYTGGGYVDMKYFGVGNSQHLSGAGADSLNIMIDDRNTVNQMYVQTIDNGVITAETAIGFAGDSYGWFDLGIAVDMGAGTASAWFRNVDNAPPQNVPLGPWIKMADFGPLPVGFSLDVAYLGIRDPYTAFDNFVSIPEPATLALLSLGGLLLRRKKS